MAVEQPQASPQAPAGDGHLDAIEQGIMSQIPSEQAELLDKVVVSGKQILYHPSTHSQAIENMRDIQDDSDPRRVALGVAAILTIVNRKATQIPVELMAPAGALLCVDVARFFQEGGKLELTPEFTGNMIEEWLAIVMQKMGFDAPQEQQEPPPQEGIPGGVSPSQRQQPQGLIASQQQVPA